MLEINDVTQILYQLQVGFSQRASGNDSAVFEIRDFGLKLIWSTAKGYDVANDWNVLTINPEDKLPHVREEILWELAKGGFFHHLRTNFPNTFKQMLSGRSGEDWHNKIIKKRLELYGIKKRYNYHRTLNQEMLNVPFAQVLSIDPGFYDFLI
ncbi:MAG: hypothetical protein WC169_11015 [Dehalococcoidia bacterium]|jgi:hypothetical protein